MARAGARSGARRDHHPVTALLSGWARLASHPTSLPCLVLAVLQKLWLHGLALALPGEVPKLLVLPAARESPFVLSSSAQAGLAHGGSHPLPSPGPSCRLLSPGRMRPWPRGPGPCLTSGSSRRSPGFQPLLARALPTFPALLRSSPSPQEGERWGKAREEFGGSQARAGAAVVLEEGLLGLLPGRWQGWISGGRVSPSAPLPEWM